MFVVQERNGFGCDSHAPETRRKPSGRSGPESDVNRRKGVGKRKRKRTWNDTGGGRKRKRPEAVGGSPGNTLWTLTRRMGEHRAIGVPWKSERRLEVLRNRRVSRQGRARDHHSSPVGLNGRPEQNRGERTNQIDPRFEARKPDSQGKGRETSSGCGAGSIDAEEPVELRSDDRPAVFLG